MTSYTVINTEFSCAHLYHQKTWDSKKNMEIFGACFTEHGHGHNYKWQVTLNSPSAEFLKNQKSNYTEWLNQTKNTLNSITKVLDHKHLNFVIPEFENKIPTTENISLYLKDKILNTKLSKFLISFRLYEMENLWTHVQIQEPDLL